MWFRLEPSTVVDGTSPAVIDFETKNIKTKSARDGGSIPPTYGKCRAVFQDKNNETQVYDFGTFSSSGCTAKDDSGYKLFSIG